MRRNVFIQKVKHLVLTLIGLILCLPAYASILKNKTDLDFYPTSNLLYDNLNESSLEKPLLTQNLGLHKTSNDLVSSIQEDIDNIGLSGFNQYLFSLSERQLFLKYEIFSAKWLRERPIYLPFPDTNQFYFFSLQGSQKSDLLLLALCTLVSIKDKKRRLEQNS